MGHDFWKEPLLLNFPPHVFFLGALSTTSQVPSGVIKFERRQTPLRPPSPKTQQLTSQQSRWMNSTTGKRTIMYYSLFFFFFAVSVSLRATLSLGWDYKWWIFHLNCWILVWNSIQNCLNFLSCRSTVLVHCTEEIQHFLLHQCILIAVVHSIRFFLM